jgi:predicted esterase
MGALIHVCKVMTANQRILAEGVTPRRFEETNAGELSLFPLPFERRIQWFGRDRSERMMSDELVTQAFGYDNGRLVTVYSPPVPPEAIVFAGDGQMISQWGRVLEAANVPSTMIVGVHRSNDETQRLQEYSPEFDPKRFAAHEKFFVEDVSRWVRSRFGVAPPCERAAVFGVSAGGELALVLGLRHPELYGVILSASPGGGYRPPDAMPTHLPRTYLVAGEREPFFLNNAVRWASALQNAAADCVMIQRDAGHDTEIWKQEFPLMIEWAFGRSRMQQRSEPLAPSKLDL